MGRWGIWQVEIALQHRVSYDRIWEVKYARDAARNDRNAGAIEKKREMQKGKNRPNDFYNLVGQYI